MPPFGGQTLASAAITQMKANPHKELGFAWFCSFESSLFSELRAKK
jgi:hypothetical protein